MHQLIVDLSTSPRRRWALTPRQRDDARSLVAVYLRDLAIDPGVAELAGSVVLDVVPEAYLHEIEGLAAALGLPMRDVLVTNLYYDVLKHLWACSAFAVDSSTGPIHARNLDWWTEDALLARTTLVTRFENAPAGTFITVGWPSFVGALSAVAPARFSITLNAVLSSDPPEVAIPVVFLVRQVLETASTFHAAVQRLASTPIASDCLLLVAGVEAGQMCVIERTPTGHAIREPSDGSIWVTNDYKRIDADTGTPANELLASSCGRYERVGELLAHRPKTLARCLEYLRDERVQMGITVQQMAFSARAGEHVVSLPA